MKMDFGDTYAAPVCKSTSYPDSKNPAIYNLNLSERKMKLRVSQGGLPMDGLKLLVSETEALEDGNDRWSESGVKGEEGKGV